MKRIVIMNCITISLIVILSYISTPDNQILANHHLITGFGSVIAFMSVLWILQCNTSDAPREVNKAMVGGNLIGLIALMLWHI